jgi:hypothetical protein
MEYYLSETGPARQIRRRSGATAATLIKRKKAGGIDPALLPALRKEIRLAVYHVASNADRKITYCSSRARLDTEELLNVSKP